MSMRHVVIGTAGHIDHGKSSLVLALTGTDPDRLQEEKARGITIDLGFAHTSESEFVLSFVDVPGHERFIRNMLAGVGGIDLVMLHIAADESVMPQTREHFEICRLLQVPAGMVVITKSDLADPATIEVVRLEIEDLVAESFLKDAPVLAVSARTGAGLPDLRRTLADLAAAVRMRPCDGPPRLPVDRVFSMKGFGTVVTGTLIGGRLCVDEELVLQPSGRAVKVRGLQVHGKPQSEAVAGQRVAVNVAGMDALALTRGETLTHPDAVSVSRHADVELELLPSAKPLRHGARVRFHQGTRELLGRVALPDSPEIRPGASGFARLHLEAPAVLVRHDRFILRAYSPLGTIAGGTVLDPLPPRRGLRTQAGVARFGRLSPRVPECDAALTMIEEAGLRGLPEPQLNGRAGVRWSERGQVAAQLEPDVLRVTGAMVSRSRVVAAENAILKTVARYHADHPLDEGIPREELRERIFGDAPLVVFDTVLRALGEKGRITARDRVALPGRRLALTEEETHVRDRIVRMVEQGGLAPPDRAALAGGIGASPEMIERLVTLLLRQRVLTRAGDVMFHERPLEELKAQIRALKGNGTTVLDVAAFKERFNVSRKYAIPLLEFLDRERVTRRVGDKRQIL
jgi:selenocysteine-specific elongation factor